MGYRHQCRTLFRYQIGIFDSQVFEPSFLIEAKKSCVYSALLCFLFWFGSTLPPQFMVGPAKDMRQNTPIMDTEYGQNVSICISATERKRSLCSCGLGPNYLLTLASFPAFISTLNRSLKVGETYHSWCTGAGRLPGDNKLSAWLF